ncbi:MAG: 2Fe-2S iron-sulfur cluster-binding protein, partial [Pseudomonadota bacterium]
MKLNINNKLVEVGDDPEMPLLWALRDIAGLKGTKFGCGLAACGACTVHVDGEPVRSCQLQVGDVDGPVTTIEAIGTID